MKTVILFALASVLFFSNANAANNEVLSKFTDNFPNIIMGEVYYITQTSFIISVDLEFKGNLESQTYEIPFENSNTKQPTVKNGDKVLVFIDKMLMKPIDNVPYSSFRLSMFDKFNGQCAYRFMNSELDNDFLSQLTSIMYQKQLATVYTY